MHLNANDKVVLAAIAAVFAAAAAGQSSGIDKVGSAVSGLDRMTQQNAAART